MLLNRRAPDLLSGPQQNRAPDIFDPAGKLHLHQSHICVTSPARDRRVGSSAVEQRPFKPLVQGSNPCQPTTSVFDSGSCLSGLELISSRLRQLSS